MEEREAPVRVVYVSPAFELGGAERSLIDLMASLRTHYPSVEVHAVLAGDGPLLREVESLGVRTTMVPLPDRLARVGDSSLIAGRRRSSAVSLVLRSATAALSARGYVRDLRNAFLRIAPSVVHTNDNKSHVLASLAIGRKLPVIWHLRDFVGSRPLVTRGLRLVSGRAAGAIAISKAIGDDARAIMPDLAVRVVHNAIDVDRFSPGSIDGLWLDELAGMEPAGRRTVRVGLVATYAYWKGQDLFLRMAARFREEEPEAAVRFYIVGGPIYRTMGSQFSEQELRSMASEMGVADRVGFIGFQRDPVNVYRALDLVVHASTRPEPFGRSIVEAMACARPVIVARAGGAAELFEDGVDAVGFEPGDEPAMVEAVRSLVGDPAGRKRLGDRARQTAVRRFSRDRLAGDVMSAYEELTGAGRPQGTSHPSPA